MNIRTISARGALVRTGAVALASVAVLGLWAPAAGAAPAATIVLDPDATELMVHSAYWGPAIVDDLPGLGVSTDPIPVMYSGTLTATLPAALVAGPSFTVELGLAPTSGGSATRTYATDSVLPADVLTVDDLGSKRYQIQLPADDTVNGDFGYVLFSGLAPAPGTSGATTDGKAYAGLTFGTAPSNVDLPLGATVQDQRCIQPGATCSGSSVTAGGAIDLVLPSSSRLTAFGLSSLATNSIRMQLLDVAGPIVSLTGTLSADGRTLSTTVPNSLPVGRYGFSTEVVDATGTLFVSAWYVVNVTNPGLRSNTGWGENEDPGPAGTSPMVPIGAGMILVAGLGTAVALRRRTSTQD